MRRAVYARIYAHILASNLYTYFNLFIIIYPITALTIIIYTTRV